MILPNLTGLLRQRIYQTACGYADGNDANSLRQDPMFRLAVGRAPLTEGFDLASGPTFSRRENSLGRRDLYQLAKAFVAAFIASHATAPAIIVLDMDHSDDPTHGQHELAFRNHHYGSYCYLPCFSSKASPANSLPPCCVPANAPRDVRTPPSSSACRACCAKPLAGYPHHPAWGEAFPQS